MIVRFHGRIVEHESGKMPITQVIDIPLSMSSVHFLLHRRLGRNTVFRLLADLSRPFPPEKAVRDLPSPRGEGKKAAGGGKNVEMVKPN